MNKEIKYIDDSAFKEAIRMDSENLFSETDEKKVLNDIYENIQANKTSQNRSDNIPRKTMRSKKKFFTPVVAVVACAMICALAVTGGIMNNLDSMTLNTASDSQNSTVDDSTDSAVRQENNTLENNEQKPTDSGEDVNVITTAPGEANPGEVKLYSGDCDCNHVNPSKAVLQKADIKTNTCSWTIMSQKSNKTMYKGDGTTITTQLKTLLKNKKDGDYTITFTYTDNEGNKIKVYDAFTIDSGEIPKDKYD